MPELIIRIANQVYITIEAETFESRSINFLDDTIMSLFSKYYENKSTWYSKYHDGTMKSRHLKFIDDLVSSLYITQCFDDDDFVNRLDQSVRHVINDYFDSVPDIMDTHCKYTVYHGLKKGGICGLPCSSQFNFCDAHNPHYKLCRL